MDKQTVSVVWRIAAALCMVTYKVAAQGDVPNSPAIIYSVPKESETSGAGADNLKSVEDGFAGQVQAPGQIFGRRPAPALPPPSYSPVDRSLENKKNWAMMTPEEVLGVQTPEKMLGVDKADDAMQSSLTPEQRFMLRQERGYTSATNSSSVTKVGDSDFRSWGRSEAGDAGNSIWTSSAADSSYQKFNQLFMGGHDGVSSAGNVNLGWKPGGGAADAIKAAAEQQAEMDRFKRLLEPESSVARPNVNMPGYNSSFGSESQQDSFNQPKSAFITYRSSLEAGSGGFAKPVGITPLPGIETQPLKKAPAPPSWAPKPPPWLSEQANPFALPPPKF